MKFAFIILLSLVLTSCSSVISQFDDVDLIYYFKDNIDESKTPDGFVVFPFEIKKITPITKYGWNIYADKNSYYLSSGIQNFSKTGDNSYLARNNGIRIAGTSRNDIEKIESYLVSNQRSFFVSPQEL